MRLRSASCQVMAVTKWKWSESFQYRSRGDHVRTACAEWSHSNRAELIELLSVRCSLMAGDQLLRGWTLSDTSFSFFKRSQNDYILEHISLTIATSHRENGGSFSTKCHTNSTAEHDLFGGKGIFYCSGSFWVSSCEIIEHILTPLVYQSEFCPIPAGGSAGWWSSQCIKL